MAVDETRPFTPSSLSVFQEYVVGAFSVVDQAYSPAPTVGSSVDAQGYWQGTGHDTSEYNSEYDEVIEGEDGGAAERETAPPEGAELSIEDEIALAAGESTESVKTGLGITLG